MTTYFFIFSGCFLWFVLGIFIFIFCQRESWIDGLYLMVQIMTTVGYGDIIEQSQNMRLFLGFYVLFCTIFVASLLSLLTERLMSKGADSFSEVIQQAHEELTTERAASFNSEDVPSPRRQATSHRLRHALTPNLHWKLFYAISVFLTFLTIGICFFRFFEDCTCFEGPTRIPGCNPLHCTATGGIQKSLIDSFYLASITMTTVGFGDVTPKSELGRLFCCIWMFFGVASTVHMIGTLSEYISVRAKLRQMDFVTADLFSEIDVDGGRQLDKYEFMIYMLRRYALVSKNHLAQIDTEFHLFDSDRDGLISLEDVIDRGL